jgi:hypothetical protein
MLGQFAAGRRKPHASGVCSPSLRGFLVASLTSGAWARRDAEWSRIAGRRMIMLPERKPCDHAVTLRSTGLVPP